MSNPVTQRFIKCHDKLKSDDTIRSSRQFALAIDTAPQSLNQVLKGKRDVTIANITMLIEKYNISPRYLMMGEGPMFIEEQEEVKTNELDKDNILYVPIAAQAGYCDQYNEPFLVEDLEAFSLPGYQDNYGEHRCFDVAGDSMEPTLFSGDRIICSLVSRDHYYNSLKDNYVYVIISKGDIVVKRVENRIRQEGVLVLNSDNTYYDPYRLEVNDISEIWAVNLKISPFMPHPSNMRNAFHDEIDRLKDTITQQADAMNKMNKSLECLLKRSR